MEDNKENPGTQGSKRRAKSGFKSSQKAKQDVVYSEGEIVAIFNTDAEDSLQLFVLKEDVFSFDQKRIKANFLLKHETSKD